MSIRDIGPLQCADEGLNHQIVDTFATISESDLAWTEKVWVSIAKADGSVQATLGLGKYPNRGVIDGFGGVPRGRKQWTVRGSRQLWSAPEESAIGPIHYQVVDALGAVRVRLEPNAVQPISFDLVLRGVAPPCAWCGGGSTQTPPTRSRSPSCPPACPRRSSRSATWCATGGRTAST